MPNDQTLKNIENKTKPKTRPDEILFYEGDLPGDLDFGDSVAIDTETQGLKHGRDRLCLAQFSSGDGICHLVRFRRDQFEAPNIRLLLTNPAITKIFHYARFDVAVFKKSMGVDVNPVYCTKIASKLARTYTDSHGLKGVVKELIGVDLSKEQQSSDWAADNLSPAQLKYAAMDVLYLHEMRAKLDIILAREGRSQMAKGCFDFLKTQADLDLGGWSDLDIFTH